jgi:hypothetical protein
VRGGQDGRSEPCAAGRVSLGASAVVSFAALLTGYACVQVCRGESDLALSLSKARLHARVVSSRSPVHRSKGLTEAALARLGYADTLVFRPGYLRGAERTEMRPFESVAAYVGRRVLVCGSLT